MDKECFQLTKLPEVTPCFKKAGGTPCKGKGCLVIDRLNELQGRGIEEGDYWKRILPHSVCRISSLSPNNEEFKQRLLKLDS